MWYNELRVQFATSGAKFINSSRLYAACESNRVDFVLSSRTFYVTIP